MAATGATLPLLLVSDSATLALNHLGRFTRRVGYPRSTKHPIEMALSGHESVDGLMLLNGVAAAVELHLLLNVPDEGPYPALLLARSNLGQTIVP